MPVTCFYSLSEQNAQLKEENQQLREELVVAEVGEAASEADYQELKEENAQLKEALEWIANYSAHLAADSVDTLPAAYMRGFAQLQKRAWIALKGEEDADVLADEHVKDVGDPVKRIREAP